MNDTQENAIRQITSRFLSMQASGNPDGDIIAALKSEGWHAPAVDIAVERVKADNVTDGEQRA